MTGHIALSDSAPRYVAHPVAALDDNIAADQERIINASVRAAIRDGAIAGVGHIVDNIARVNGIATNRGRGTR